MRNKKHVLAKIISLHLLLIWFCIPSASSLTIVKVLPVELSTKHLMAIEKIACLNPFNIKAGEVTGYRYEEARGGHRYADVTCKTHGEFKGAPIYYSSSCAFEGKKWSCEKPDLHIFVTLKNRKVDVIPNGVASELANDTIVKISSYGALRGLSIDEAIGNSCYISSTSHPEELELNCTGYIKVSFWCPQPEITHCPRVVDVQKIYD